jgi:hypothetical protein
MYFVFDELWPLRCSCAAYARNVDNDHGTLSGRQRERRWCGSVSPVDARVGLGNMALDMKGLRGDQPIALDSVIGEIIDEDDPIDADAYLHQRLVR